MSSPRSIPHTPPHFLTPREQGDMHAGQVEHADHPHHLLSTMSTEEYSFPKQPITIASPTHQPSDADNHLVYLDADPNKHVHIQLPSTQAKPVSLLTSLMQSPEHQQHQPVRKPAPSSVSGLSSAKSSAPSTAISSPNGHMGILHAGQVLKFDAPPTASILRRGSTSSEGGDATGMAFGFGEGLMNKLEKVEERRERVGWADQVERTESAPPVSRTTSLHRPTALKFTVAHPAQSAAASQPMGQSLSDGAVPKRPDSPFARERKMQGELQADEDDEEEEEGQAPSDDEASDEEEHVSPRQARVSQDGNESDGSDNTDAGYQEDEEDGMFSDDADSAPSHRFRQGRVKFPFARSTNYRHDHPSPSGSKHSPPPAPAILPPPFRRGRGHIRVVDDNASSEAAKGCSRHCSPPPTRSRSGSTAKTSSSHSRSDKSKSPSRLSDAGPRDGRAGSPMPARMSESETETDDGDDDEEDEEEGDVDQDEDQDQGLDETQSQDREGADDAVRETSPGRARGGWRSDDAMFQGPVKPIRVDALPRNVSAPPSQQDFDATASPNQHVFDSTDDDGEHERVEHQEGQAGAATGNGVRGFLRRASEHILPAFRRPSTSLTPGLDTSASQAAGPTGAIVHSSAAAAPPALDDTPALGQSFSHAGLEQRLEQTLATPSFQPQPASQARPSLDKTASTSSTSSAAGLGSDSGTGTHLSRARSLGGKVTFTDPVRPPEAGGKRLRAKSVNLAMQGRRVSLPFEEGRGMSSKPIPFQRRKEGQAW